MTTCDAYPLAIDLPGGVRALIIPGSRPPRYTISGAPTDIDVTIPDELHAAGWIWHRSTLFQPYAGQGDGPGIAIMTCMYGIPGVFEQARTHGQIRATLATARAPKVHAEQLAMEL